MDLTRREVVAGAAAAAAGLSAIGAGAAAPRIRIGSCGVGLEQAKAAGLDGVEVGVGDAADTLWIAGQDARRDLKARMKETGLVIPSFMMGLLNSYPLASDPRGPAWLEQSIDAAKDLGTKVLLVAFFGRGSLLERSSLNRAAVDAVVERLRAVAPRAEKAGVVLAIENTLDAQQNAEIVRRVGSKAVKVYYDIRNSTDMGYDVPAEIRALGKQIVQFHFKDGGAYLGEGKIKLEPIAEAIKAIRYKGWIVLETSCPSGDLVADAQRNAATVKRVLGLA